MPESTADPVTLQGDSKAIRIAQEAVPGVFEDSQTTVDLSGNTPADSGGVDVGIEVADPREVQPDLEPPIQVTHEDLKGIK